MNTIQIEKENHIATVTLSRGSSNAMNSEMILELHNCFIDLEANDDIHAVIITGRNNFFSSGLDLFEIYDLDESSLRLFWIRFLALQTTLVAFKKPLVCAINGHAPAGGCILAICSDYRIMAEGKFIIGLNELPVGIMVPEFIFHLYAFWIGERHAYQNLLQGRLLNPYEAAESGLVDLLCAQEDLMTTAENQAKTWLGLDRETWSQSKHNIRKDLIAMFQADHSEILNTMMKLWWKPDNRKKLKIIIENFKQNAAKQMA